MIAVVHLTGIMTYRQQEMLVGTAGHNATIVTLPYDWYSGGVVFQNQDIAKYDFVSSTCPTQNWDYSWDSAYILMYIN